MRTLIIRSLWTIAVFSMITSCKKESFITSPSANLNITADTIKFDTVFTSIGSVTKSFKIINENNQKILLSHIKLMGSAPSAYHININGVATNELTDITIDPNDSIYVFVAVTIDPNLNTNPFIISDSIEISFNGNNRLVQLESFGKNAHFIRDQVITDNVSWTNDLPYVILGNLQIDTTATLFIDAGCKIYLHANAAILVDGTLQAIGAKNNEVQFNGDRLDEPYCNLSGAWPGIYFRNESKNNQLIFAIIKNATRAISVENPSINSNPKLLIKQSIIDNAFETGIESLNSSIDADNTLISNCGNNIKIALGGDYAFTNCTIVAYSTSYLLHAEPVLQVSNYSMQNGAITTTNINALFTNCIFWGDGGTVDNELSVIKEGANVFNVQLQHCLFKNLVDPPNTILTAIISNQDPLFNSVDIENNYFDFRTTNNLSSPVIDQGVNTSFLFDLNNNTRQVGLSTDIGCYENP